MNFALLSIAISAILPLIAGYYAARMYIYMKTRKSEDGLDLDDLEDGIQKPKVITTQEARGALNVFLIVFICCLGISGSIAFAVKGVSAISGIVQTAFNVRTWIILLIAVIALYLAASGMFSATKDTSMFLSFHAVKVENDKVYVDDVQGFLRDFGMALLILVAFALIL